jgi:hypothetical protein
MRKILFVTLYLISFCSFGQIKSILIDKNTKETISFATIYDSTNRVGTHSDEKGYFTIKCQNSITISHILYKPRLIVCGQINDTIFLMPRDFILNSVEIISTKIKEKKKKIDIIKAGIWDGKSKMQYEGIKEAALFINNPIKKSCYINKVFFSFSNVKFDSDGRGTIKDKDILLLLKIYNKLKFTSEPESQLLQRQLTYRLKANTTKLTIDLIDMEVVFPPDGGFVAVEFLGYFEKERFISIDFKDTNIKKQFAPSLSGNHLNRDSFYRKTFSNEWNRVNVDFDGFFNFNFGIELVLPQN